MTKTNGKETSFDPVRDVLMMKVNGPVKWGICACMTVMFCLCLLFPMGWADKSVVVAMTATACAALLIFVSAAHLKESPVILLLCSGMMFALAMCAHLSMMDINPGRVTKLLSPMMEEMWNYDLLTAMAWEDKSWSGGYLVILGLLSRLETFPWLYAVKLVNLVFISLGALAVQSLYLYNDGKAFDSVLVTGAAMLAVTILFNSGAWAHCDAIFAAFSLWGLVLLLKNHPWPGCLLWGFAVAFKLQAAFLFPLLIPLFMERRMSIRHLLALAAGFLVWHIPMFMDGQTFLSVLGRYNAQITEVAYLGAGLTDNAPGVYGLMVIASVREFSGMGLFFGEALALLLVSGMIRKAPLNSVQWIRCALLLAFGLPMILPQMNVRALYLAFLIALADARNVRGTIIAILIELISLLSYMKGFFGNEVLPLVALSIVSLVLTFYMILDCLKVQKEQVYAER